MISTPRNGNSRGLGVLTSALRAQGVWIFSGTINKWDKINHEVTIMIEFLLNIMTILLKQLLLQGNQSTQNWLLVPEISKTGVINVH